MIQICVGFAFQVFFTNHIGSRLQEMKRFKAFERRIATCKCVLVVNEHLYPWRVFPAGNILYSLKWNPLFIAQWYGLLDVLTQHTRDFPGLQTCTRNIQTHLRNRTWYPPRDIQNLSSVAAPLYNTLHKQCRNFWRTHLAWTPRRQYRR